MSINPDFLSSAPFNRGGFNHLSSRMMHQLVNRLLALDAEAKQKLEAFEPSVFLIQVTDLGLNYAATIKQGELNISDGSDLIQSKAAKPTESSSKATAESENARCEITATISGTSSAFLSAIQEQHKGDSIFKGQLNFSGQINSAKKLQSFAQSLKIDWQEPLAQLFGDPIGHSLASGIQDLAGWLKSTLTQAPINLGEYLQEEVQLTPSRFEQAHFSDQVDQLRSRLDRLNARFQRIQSKQTAKSSEREKAAGDDL
ncbi:MAG: SCP2 sterol-binding domain-containing protein [Enterobacterales bacterium]|nr:SCP2 sterol-binding domain-containing protein [Enterobacterales bacterium]